MEIQIFEQGSLKIKVKKTILAVNPKSSIQKFDADAIILIDKNCDVNRVNNYRVVIDSAGEYEVSGLKISGLKTDIDMMFILSSENISALVAKASSLEKISTDKIGEYEILIINVDQDLNQGLVTAMEPKLVVLYGERAKEGAKVLGKDAVSTSSKISFSEDKLPEEMDVMLLA